MPNVSNMPAGEEFVRAWPDVKTDEKLYGIAVWPMQCFRLPTEALLDVTDAALVEANKAYPDHDEEYVSQILNYHVNQGLAKLAASNVLIAMDDSYSLQPLDWVKAYGPNYMIRTNDGYTIMNPGLSAPINGVKLQ